MDLVLIQENRLGGFNKMMETRNCEKYGKSMEFFWMILVRLVHVGSSSGTVDHITISIGQVVGCRSGPTSESHRIFLASHSQGMIQPNDFIMSNGETNCLDLFSGFGVQILCNTPMFRNRTHFHRVQKQWIHESSKCHD